MLLHPAGKRTDLHQTATGLLTKVALTGPVGTILYLLQCCSGRNVSEPNPLDEKNMNSFRMSNLSS